MKGQSEHDSAFQGQTGILSSWMTDILEAEFSETRLSDITFTPTLHSWEN